MSNTENAIAVGAGVLALGTAVAGTYFLLRATKKITKASLALDTEAPPSKVLTVIKDTEKPFAVDASAPLVPLPATKEGSYAHKAVSALRSSAVELSGEGSTAKMNFTALWCTCELVYSAVKKDSAVVLETELTAEGPVGPAYLVSGLIMTQALLRLLLLKFKLEADAKAV